MLRHGLVLHRGERRRAAYRADDDLRRGDRLSLRPVSGAAAAVGADHEPARADGLPDDLIPVPMLSRHDLLRSAVPEGTAGTSATEAIV